MRVPESILVSTQGVASKVDVTTLDGQFMRLRAPNVVAIEDLPADPRSTVYTGARCRVYFDGSSIVIRSSAKALDAAIDALANSDPFRNFVQIQDQKASNTAGGTATSGAWRTRDLNTEVYDGDSLASVASNQISLAAGIYLVWASAPGYQCYQHQVRLYNISGSAVLLLGSNARSSSTDDTQTLSVVRGRISLSGTTTLELQHRVSTTKATYGFGVPTAWGTEVYASISFVRLGSP